MAAGKTFPPVKVLWLWACAYCSSGSVVEADDSGMAMDLAREAASDHVLANDNDHSALFGSAHGRAALEQPKVSVSVL